ncbi:MAG TPA: acetylxylan esterase [Candidatus Limnocylindrales bacterium]|jgi:cephalosporin-C deacetylase
MAQFDLPLDELRGYRPPRDEPADFDAFWSSTIENSRRVRSETRFADVDTRLRTIRTADVTFSGFAGQPIRAWLQWPSDAEGPLATVVQFLGYGGGRGKPTDWLFWASTGFAQLVMDTRGQGGGWLSGDTSDIVDGGTGSQSPGVMTRGILDPSTYYYRRLITDAVLAVDSAAEHPMVDPDRIVVAGISQGGGLALAAAALARRPVAALVDVPFLCHFRRALEVCDTDPYAEIRRFLRVHRTEEERVFRTLSYVDGRSFAARATIPALFSVGLEDDITPPSTVFAAYNEYDGPKEIRVWPFSGHEAPDVQQQLEQLEYLAGLGLP